MEETEFEPRQSDFKPLLFPAQHSQELNMHVSDSNVHSLNHGTILFHRFLWVIFFLHRIYFTNTPICSLINNFIIHRKTGCKVKCINQKTHCFQLECKVYHSSHLHVRWKKVEILMARGGRWQELFSLWLRKQSKGGESCRAPEILSC